MNEVWNLDPIYQGFDDPAFEAELAELKNRVAGFGAFAETPKDSRCEESLCAQRYTV